MQEALKLTSNARLDKPNAEINAIWQQEVLMRLKAYDAGKIKSYSIKEVLGDKET